MLRKVVLINTKVFGKAEITLDDCDSLQLVGPNNVGKSTLIYALNFLFVVDGSKMSFSGQRKGDKETIHHYFPTANQSYILFEVNKLGSYTILVKRDNEGELEYYRLNGAYIESCFFEEKEGAARVLRWDEVTQKLAEQGIAIEQYRNKSEVFNAVYQRGVHNPAVVWLEDGVKTDGLSNNFSKVYRYLINTKLITNKSLKETLIIADNRENESLNFSQKNKKDITDLLRIGDEIRSIKQSRADFISFREIYNEFSAKTALVAEYLYAFNQACPPVLHNLELKASQKMQDVASDITELNEILKPKKDELNKRIGNKEAEIDFQLRELNDYQEQLEEVQKLESLQFLSQSLLNLEKKKAEQESILSEIGKPEASGKEAEKRLERLLASMQAIENQIKNYDNLLIHNISKDPAQRKLLNALLSGQVSSLPKDQILKPLTKASKRLKIFDAEIDISEGIVEQDFQSVDELKQELKYQKKEKERLEKIVALVNNLEKSKAEIAQLGVQIEQLREQIRRVKMAPALEKRKAEVNKKLDGMRREKAELEKELLLLNESINRKETTIRMAEDERRKIEERIKDLSSKKAELEEISIEPVPYETDEELEKIFGKIRIYYQDRLELKAKKDKQFEHLKNSVGSNLASEEEFIRFMEDELACIQDKEKSIEGLLQSISTQFSHPAYSLIKRYEDFRQFINNKINKILSQTRISNIESFRIELVDNRRLIEEIRKISAIQDIDGQLLFDFDHSENLKILNQYLDAGRKVAFSELFDLELHLTIRGNLKKVDLANQVESDGTDRMIRLVMIMSVINRLAVSHQHNRVALFIDEVATIDEQNRPELVRFCKDHGFIPIFAAPAAVEGFNKYYFLFPNKGKINVNEKQHVAFVERN